MEEFGSERVWQHFSGRIAAVLSGGGARGAYEAGVLLAFQDARLPTHIITATSVASINAASFAARSNSLVGNAEPLTASWFDLTPPQVGIEWTRYVWMLTGLIAASAGLGNLARHLLASGGFSFEVPDPALTWLALGLAGTAVLLLYDRLPYLGYVIRNSFRGTSWKPDPVKTRLSLAANLLVFGFLGVVIHLIHAHRLMVDFVTTHPEWVLLAIVVMFALVVSRWRWRTRVGALLHRLLNLPLRSGLFANFERGRYLRQRISSEHLRASPIRVVFAATDLETGDARFFSNASREILAADPHADRQFISKEVMQPDDLIRAVIASTALPIAYEPISYDGHLYADGALVANQPIRPALRLGADVLFLVMMEPPQGQRVEVRTFIDVGLRALDILMAQNLLTDLKILNNVNAACEKAAADRGLEPEEVEIDMGTRRYRWVKCLTICPATALEGTVLDFSEETTGPAILQGYLDACVQIENFLAYARGAKFGRTRQVLKFAPEHDPSTSSTSRS